MQNIIPIIQKFVNNLLELEMLLQSDCWQHVDAIQELIDLYSLAVEHFNDLTDHYSHQPDCHALLLSSQRLGRLYIERMQNLMLRPDIIKAMQSVSLKQYESKFACDKSGVLTRMQQDTQVFGDILRDREADQLKRVITTSEESTDQTLGDILLNHKEITRKIERELALQGETLHRRLAERRKQMAHRRMGCHSQIRSLLHSGGNEKYNLDNSSSIELEQSFIIGGRMRQRSVQLVNKIGYNELSMIKGVSPFNIVDDDEEEDSLQDDAQILLIKQQTYITIAWAPLGPKEKFSYPGRYIYKEAVIYIEWLTAAQS